MDYETIIKKYHYFDELISHNFNLLHESHRMRIKNGINIIRRIDFEFLYLLFRDGVSDRVSILILMFLFTDYFPQRCIFLNYNKKEKTIISLNLGYFKNNHYYCYHIFNLNYYLQKNISGDSTINILRFLFQNNMILINDLAF